MKKEDKKQEAKENQEPIEKLKDKLKDLKDKQNKKEHEQKIDPKDQKILDLTETSQRLQAEFENYKKYVEKKNSEFLKYCKADIIEKLLPILDSFEMALKNTTDKEKFIQGIELIYSQLYSTLEKEGLKKIDSSGKLDPDFHEVLLKQESDKAEDTILEELQKGYLLNEKVIRHTKVKVSKKK
jgi:molecular chaperone GrpE